MSNKQSLWEGSVRTPIETGGEKNQVEQFKLHELLRWSNRQISIKA